MSIQTFREKARDLERAPRALRLLQRLHAPQTGRTPEPDVDEPDVDGEELPEPIGESPSEDDAARDPDPAGDEGKGDDNDDVENEN